MFPASARTSIAIVVLVGGSAACGIVYGSPVIQSNPNDGGSDAAFDGPSDAPFDAPPAHDAHEGEPTDPNDADEDGYASDGAYEGPWATMATGQPPACSQPPVTCGGAFPGSGAFASSQDAANAIVGQWSFCGDEDGGVGGGFYGPGQAGEEYTADGTYYQLVVGPGGTLVRNLDPTTISNWELQLLPHGALEIHTGMFGGDQRQGGLSACPPSLITIGLETRVN